MSEEKNGFLKFSGKIPIAILGTVLSIVIAGASKIYSLSSEVETLKAQMQVSICEREKANVSLAKIETSLEYIKQLLDEIRKERNVKK